MANCINCGDPEVDYYDVMVRGDQQDDIPICDDCHEALILDT